MFSDIYIYALTFHFNITNPFGTFNVRLCVSKCWCSEVCGYSGAGLIGLTHVPVTGL